MDQLTPEPSWEAADGETCSISAVFSFLPLGGIQKKIGQPGDERDKLLCSGERSGTTLRAASPFEAFT